MPRRLLALGLRAPVVLFDLGAGRLLGHRFLLLTHRGRRTGFVRRTVLEVLRWDPDRREAVVLAGFGPDSDWLRNIERAPALEVQVGRDRFVPAHRVLGPAEAAASLAGYEQRNRAIAPIVRAILSRLAGFRYDGSSAGRARLLTELPVVAFWPARQEPA
ncbi:nitroreductase family deazaflavin-dependent oxidoreductase [Pseudonocardia bannensis]|uniref:nitroreductase family deazaflavin-dependent oxidoreductase n=1 Tax=Pseudonocardia bannensis TaxID=630973 RepID=UPI0028B00809|nr:nitroreductase family deazaflavin-dependent oxidoreductase [Pseudonocardia bannensis]